MSTPRSRRVGYSAATASRATGSPWQRNSCSEIASDVTNFRLLGRPEYERRCIDLFWEAYFPSGRPLPASVSRSYTCTWTQTARKLYGEDDSLRYALWANCLLLTGRRHGTVWMFKEASRLYGKALVHLRRALRIPNGAMRDTSIATVKLLAMFEVCSLRQPPISRSRDIHTSRGLLAAGG